MRRIARFVAAATLVILLVTPNPLGLRPAQAFAPVLALAALDPAVLGAVVVGAGVIAGTAAHYAPSIYQSADVAVSSVGVVTRNLYQVAKFSYGAANNIFVGAAEQLSLDFSTLSSSVVAWIAAHAADVPNLFQAQSAALVTTYAPPAIGNVYVDTSGIAHQLTKVVVSPEYYYTSIPMPSFWASNYPYTFWGMPTSTSAFPPSYVAPVDSSTSVGGGKYNVSYHTINFTWVVTTASSSPPPSTSTYSPAAFSSAVSAAIASRGPAVAAEIDKVIAANHDAVTNVPPFDTSKAQDIAQGVAAQNDATQAAQIAAADPTNAAKASDAARLQAIANQAAIASQAAQLPITAQQPQSSPTPDLPYNPSALTGPSMPLT